MMGKRFDKTFNGLVFLMGGDEQCFWMKNCIIPLDIIFIRNNKIIKIHKDCPPCKSEDCDRYEGEGDMVLEINGGDCDKYDIVEGDKILID
jgi:uncharacterized membrane protein (UPF0127 family)